MPYWQDPTHPTGVNDDYERGSGAVVRARERKANAALQMRMAGATWDEIAEVIGYPSADRAIVAVELALEKELHDEDNKKKMRTMAGKRLERLLRGVWTKAIDPAHPEHLQAVARAREIIDRHAKLYGLDAPTEFVMSSPSAAELERWVATVVQESRPALSEADIFDAEVVEDRVQALNFEETPDAAPDQRVPSEDPVHHLRGDAEPDLPGLQGDEHRVEHALHPGGGVPEAVGRPRSGPGGPAGGAS